MDLKTMLVAIFLFSIASVARGLLTLDADRPFVRKPVSDMATLLCCYHNNGVAVGYTWLVTIGNKSQMVNMSNDRLTSEYAETSKSRSCHNLVLRELQLTDAGFYQCLLDISVKNLTTHGTYLQVYKSMEKILNISEDAKNQILTAQGILLLLCVLLPGGRLLCKSREMRVLTRKKSMREEENIYEGLRIEDVSSPYDQIQRAPAETAYEDVYPNEGECHLEKP